MTHARRKHACKRRLFRRLGRSARQRGTNKPGGAKKRQHIRRRYAGVEREWPYIPYTLESHPEL